MGAIAFRKQGAPAAFLLWPCVTPHKTQQKPSPVWLLQRLNLVLQALSVVDKSLHHLLLLLMLVLQLCNLGLETILGFLQPRHLPTLQELCPMAFDLGRYTDLSDLLRGDLAALLQDLVERLRGINEQDLVVLLHNHRQLLGDVLRLERRPQAPSSALDGRLAAIQFQIMCKFNGFLPRHLHKEDLDLHLKLPPPRLTDLKRG
mmetsp:Transcript_101096/g.171002  ORF Transcript_101096/g.171002 Transcript_101096/m.171002 type:complete len:203 (-) Transcript_101096:17-625(-)|eukprot:CAMPEP_0174383758 /NCGR_PEP_ID=MMETSP0811_2-20130205/125464_1 /TAXON_ID=73025 ORGANISM="Eutreptiella gymnastica-like, Strain CCMP1594" /NCGR_SAMPLE_ID=MMETSP0811_2 /ASSEMBLY_ACC=CAM_ASM_000667 /LENGTH=202 /DNA_ID=CAMNT_0015537481 /DNA_START=1390 /DNA_END=1998 /DNA_ORIENTATION=+